jgi:malate dehydrogenase (oxaloacetate-decarboxylating)
MSLRDEALSLHANHKGKIEVRSKVSIQNEYDLSLAYTPGVAEPCKEIAQDKTMVYKYTSKSNLVAIVSDGTAVLGLGDIGPEAALPVMEGKAILFKEFGGVDAFPLCIATKDPEEIVKLIKQLEPTFGGINLEDISAPKCFEIEKRLKEVLNIPVFHDDQHGTAIVVLAGLINALKLAGKSFKDVTAVINGAGSAGIAITKLLLDVGIYNVILCDLNGIVHKDADWLNEAQKKMAIITNIKNVKGTLNDALRDSDVFIGVSGPGVLKKEDVKLMKNRSIIFALANPVPEIMPHEAIEAGAFIIATGRSDFPNQINNVLAFPGIFRGALDVKASDITEGMKLAAANAIAGLIKDSELNPEYIIPKPFDKRVAKAVAKGVAQCAIDEGIAAIKTIIFFD